MSLFKSFKEDAKKHDYKATKQHDNTSSELDLFKELLERDDVTKQEIWTANNTIKQTFLYAECGGKKLAYMKSFNPNSKHGHDQLTMFIKSTKEIMKSKPAPKAEFEVRTLVNPHTGEMQEIRCRKTDEITWCGSFPIVKKANPNHY